MACQPCCVYEQKYFFCYCFKTSCNMKINTHRLSRVKRSDFSYSTGPWSVSRRVNWPSCGTSNRGIQSLSRRLPGFFFISICFCCLAFTARCFWLSVVPPHRILMALDSHGRSWVSVTEREHWTLSRGGFQSGPDYAHLFSNDSEKLNNIYCCHGVVPRSVRVVQCILIINTLNKRRLFIDDPWR